MFKFHGSGLFVHIGPRVLLNRLPSGVKSFSIANGAGEIIVEQPATSRYKFFPNGNILVVNLENGRRRMFQLTSKKEFIEVYPYFDVNESDLEGEDVLLYHLGLLGQKYSQN